MKATLFKEVGYSLSKLIEDIDVGEIGLPDIQRPFVWTPTKVRDLFDSMYQGFPVGYLLFWGTTGNGMARPIGTDSKQSVPRLLIVDGQQRLTSLYAVLKGLPVLTSEHREKKLRIAFRPRDQQFDVADATKDHDPEFIADISELWAGSLSRNRFVRDFITDLSNHRVVSDEEEDHLNEAIDRLYDLQSYPFTALELSSTIDEERVADVFVRINSKGVTLNQADFILTLMSVWWDEGRKQLESFSKACRKPSSGEPSPFNHFIEPDPDQLLRVAVGLGFRRGQLRAVYSLLRGRDIETDQYSATQRDKQFAVLQEAQGEALDVTNWSQFLNCLVRAGFRSKQMITSENVVLYAYVFFLIGKRDYGVPPDELRDVIARWYFMTALTGRYSSSPESSVEADLARLRDVSSGEEFVSLLSRVSDDVLTDDFWTITLPNNLATSTARSPTLYGYYAALNLLDARPLFSSMKLTELLDPALRTSRTTVERHHLFPKAYLKTLGIESTKDVNQIANLSFIEWPDNAEIGARSPADYFPELWGRETSPEDAAFWHALPPGWESMEYREFLDARKKKIAQVVREGYRRLVENDQPALGSEPLEGLIAAGESGTVELKSAARYNEHTKQRDERIELSIVKSVAGFANGDGGSLVIGVDDDGVPVGLANDLKLVPKGDLDRYELWLSGMLGERLGRPALAGLSITFPTMNSTVVCRIDVRPSHRPVFVSSSKGGDKAADFYVRMGNSTRKLTTDEVLEYQRVRWP